MYLLMRVKSLMSLKVWSNLGLAKKNQNHHMKGCFQKIILKVNLLMGIRHFFTIFLIRALESTAKSSKLRRANKCPAKTSWVHASEARSANDRAKHSPRKPNKNRQAKRTKKSKQSSKRASKRASKQAPNKLINQSINQQTKQATNQLTNRTTKQTSKQPTNQPTNQPSQSTK